MVTFVLCYTLTFTHVVTSFSREFFIAFFSSHIPSRHEREVNEFRQLEREKSFDEARTAVQSQIEKIFMKTAAGSSGNNNQTAKGMPTLPPHTTTNRVSRRDLEARNSGINNNHSRRRMSSLEKKVCINIIPQKNWSKSYQSRNNAAPNDLLLALIRGYRWLAIYHFHRVPKSLGQERNSEISNKRHKKCEIGRQRRQW